MNKKHNIGVFLIAYLSCSHLMRQCPQASCYTTASTMTILIVTLGDFTIKPFLRWLSAGQYRPLYLALYINHSNQPAAVSVLCLLTWPVWMLVKFRSTSGQDIISQPMTEWLPWYVCLCASWRENLSPAMCNARICIKADPVEEQFIFWSDRVELQIRDLHCCHAIILIR